MNERTGALWHCGGGGCECGWVGALWNGVKAKMNEKWDLTGTLHGPGWLTISFALTPLERTG